MEIGPIS